MADSRQPRTAWYDARMFTYDEEDDPEVARRRIRRGFVIWLISATAAFLFAALLFLFVIIVIVATIRAAH